MTRAKNSLILTNKIYQYKLFYSWTIHEERIVQGIEKEQNLSFSIKLSVFSKHESSEYHTSPNNTFRM